MTNPEQHLPPGFRFHPTDEELIVHYLKNKANSIPCAVSIIAEVDIYKFNPWDLPAKAAFGDKEWYFFSPRDRKYPNGIRPNRAAGSGYWKATGTDKPIVAVRGSGKESIGVKKALVFYRGKPPKGTKTNWIMHEYRLSDSGSYANQHFHRSFLPLKNKDASMRLDDWVLCRIYEKSNNQSITGHDHHDYESNVEDGFVNSCFQQYSFPDEAKLPKSGSLSDFFASDADYLMLSRILNDDVGAGQEQVGCLTMGLNASQNHSQFDVLESETPACKKQRLTNWTLEEGSSSKWHDCDLNSSALCTMARFGNELGSGQYGSTNQSYANQQIMVLNSHLQRL